jgi:cytidylate kinase
MSSPRLFLITGAMAAGKSTVAESLAQRLDSSVHLRGDVFRKMIVNGAAAMGPELSPEASRQLALRHRSPAIVVLSPKPEVLAQRDRNRAKTGYGEHFPPSVLALALEHATPRLGLWIDSSDMSVDEVVECILGEFGQD